MALIPSYAYFDASGDAVQLLEGASLSQAAAKAHSLFQKHTPIYFDGDLGQLAAESEVAREENPIGDFATAEQTLTALGLSPLSREDVLGAGNFPDTPAGLKKAHAVLRPLFTEDREAGVKSYSTPETMMKQLLRPNAKTEKAYEGLTSAGGQKIDPSLSRGLLFMPHALGRKHWEDGPKAGEPMFTRTGLPEMLPVLGACVGSSAACRETCLIFSGENQKAFHNNVSKGRTLEALCLAPAAFCRMLLEATRWHIADCKKNGLVPYIRPNVLSDIAWELLWPTWCELFPEISWYDYTKVPNRDVSKIGGKRKGKLKDGRDQYDLTFSFSGKNIAEVREELERGRRVAVVFARRPKAGARAADPVDDILLFGKYQVLDGDWHDLRPLDPQGTCVGLRFKMLFSVPKGITIGTRSEQFKKASSFVVGGRGAVKAATEDDIKKAKDWSKRRIELFGELMSKGKITKKQYDEQKDAVEKERDRRLSFKVSPAEEAAVQKHGLPAKNAKYLVQVFVDEDTDALLIPATPLQQNVAPEILSPLGNAAE
jgi:hypothetical protein